MRGRNSIRHVEINLGKLCNNRCLFCMTGPKDPFSFAPLSEVKKEIENYSRRNFNSLGFLGGEPTIYPQIMECITCAKEMGFKQIHLVSNGRRYSDMRFLKSLVNAGVNRFSVSIHSHIPKVEDQLTRVDGGFKQKLHGLKNLVACRRAGIIKNPIAINIVINRLNFKTLPETLFFFKNIGISEFRLNFMRVEGRAEANFQKLSIRYSDCIPEIKKVLSLGETLCFGTTLEGFPFCVLRGIRNPEKYTGELKDHINLVVCLNDSEKGKYARDTFLWKERRCDMLKVKNKNCKKCIYNNICEGVWKGYVEKMGFDEFKPIDR